MALLVAPLHSQTKTSAVYSSRPTDERDVLDVHKSKHGMQYDGFIPTEC